MTRIVAIADVHSDARALETALGRARHLEADIVICAGDAIDSSLPDGSEETIQALRDAGAIVVAGNHERWASEVRGTQGGL